MCPPTTRTKDTSIEELLRTPATSPRHAIELAQELNAKVGHENYGCLSFTHGFAPQLTPPPRLPGEFAQWDELGRRLPELWSTGQLQRYIDEDFPELDATKLPQEHALRAAHILGITIHAYWHVGGLRAPDGGEELVPKNLQRPWYHIVTELLNREHPFMGFYEMLMAAFNYPDPESAVFPKSLPEHKVSWTDKQKDAYGMYEYDPSKVLVETLTQVVSLSGVMTEKAFFCSFAEMNCRGAPMVTHIVDAQEATIELVDMGFLEGKSLKGTEPHTRLCNALDGIRQEMSTFTDAFGKIHGMRASDTYVDPTVWAEAIAPVDKPFPGVKVGPSGAGMPLSIILDAFFQRSEHGNFIGKEVKRQLSLYPPHWNRFIHAVRAHTAVGPIISAGNDNELKGYFYGAFHSFVGDDGFLGVHRLKMYGYMEFTKKLARGKKKGYAGLLKERIWTMIAKFMHDAMLERSNVPLDARSSMCQVAEFLPTAEKETEVAHHVRINVKGTGIQTSPGDRMGVLYESDVSIVKEALMAFANYDKSSIDDLEKVLISVNDEWRTILRSRPEYHSSLGIKYDDTDIVPHEIPLLKFLQYGRLRPATHDMVRIAYAATLSPMLLKFLETHRESLLQGPDLIHLICRSHANASKMLLRSDKDDEKSTSELFAENCEKLFKYADLHNDGYVSRKSMVRIGRAVGTNDSAQDDTIALFNKYDTDKTGKLHYDQFKKMVMDKALQKGGSGSLVDLFQVPSLCEIFPPIDFRIYSIASSDKKEPGEVHLCVEKVRYTQKDPTSLISPIFSDMEPDHTRFGASSNFMKKSTTTDNEDKNVVVKHQRQPMFQLPPAESNTPVIMFAAGSGVAPFRSFWQEVAIRHQEAEESGLPKPPKTTLIMQSRARDAVPFKDELAEMVGKGVIDLHMWLSREDYVADFSSGKPNWVPGKRGYVHKEILEGGALRDMLEFELSDDGKAVVYMCSGAGFATNIMNSISDIIGEHGIEMVMSHQRLKLEVFTSSKYDPNLPKIPYSDFITTNKFRKQDENTRLEMVIDGLMYDVKDFATRHPGGAELIYLYCGMDASVPWRSVGHDTASEVLSQLEMYKIGRLITASENVHLACSTASIPLRLPQITDTEGPEIVIPESKMTNVRRYFTDAWNAVGLLLVESENIMLLGYMQFWDFGARLTSAEPDSSEEHLCTWEGETSSKKKRSILMGQMFTATHRKLWNELFPSIFGPEFGIALSALSPEGLPTDMANFRVSDDHTWCAAFVDLLEEHITDFVNSDEAKTYARVPPAMHAFFDHVRELDEKILIDLKTSFAKIMKCFENYGSVDRDNEDSQLEVDHLLEVVKSAVAEMTQHISIYCQTMKGLALKHFVEKQANAAFDRLKNDPDEGGFCRLFPLPEKKDA